jgi:hypothetical protein
MANLIFLDLDGVLCHRNYNDPKYPRFADSFDPKCVARLNTICKETEAKIAIHSTWINVVPRNPLQYIQDRLKSSGFDLSFLHNDWPVPGPKPENIYAWLKNHPGLNYIILEDEQIFPNTDKYNQERLVKVFGGWYEYGMQDKHVEEAIYLLKGK